MTRTNLLHLTADVRGADDQNEAMERIRASKRLSAYRDMADEQINNILATMITISNVRKDPKANEDSSDESSEENETITRGDISELAPE